MLTLVDLDCVVEPVDFVSLVDLGNLVDIVEPRSRFRCRLVALVDLVNLVDSGDFYVLADLIDLVNLEPTPDSFISSLYVAIADFVDIVDLVDLADLVDLPDRVALAATCCPC